MVYFSSAYTASEALCGWHTARYHTAKDNDLLLEIFKVRFQDFAVCPAGGLDEEQGRTFVGLKKERQEVE